MRTGSTDRASRRRPPSRSSLVVGLVIGLLGTVPVLVPLLVTRDGGMAAAPPPGPAAAGIPALPRSRDGAEPAGAGIAAAPVPAAGKLVAGPTTPAAAATTSAPAPIPARSTRPGPTPTAPAGTSSSDSGPPPTTLLAAPDLMVVAVTWSPEQPAAGQPVTFTAVVRNAGTEATPEVTHQVGFAIDGTPATWSSSGSTPLAPGEERSYSADGGPAGPTWTALPGEHELQTYVDDVDRIAETDDGNNIMTVTLTIT